MNTEKMGRFIAERRKRQTYDAKRFRTHAEYYGQSGLKMGARSFP